MGNKKRLIVLSLLGGFCVLLAVGLRSCILSIVNPEPWKVGTVAIPDGGVSITLWAGSMQEALIQPYDGVYRIVEISQRDKPPMYYDIPSTITEDVCRMEVFWYPTNNVIRFKDTKFAAFAQEFRAECLLDLNANEMYAVIRGQGVTHIAILSKPRNELSFPHSHNEERVAHSYSGQASDLNAGSSETVMIGTEESRPSNAPWTLSPGVLIGIIEPKQ
jgi:hypothetical protein